MIFLLLMVMHNSADKYYHADVIETNHYYDQKGDYIFTQLIIWRKDSSDGKLHNYGWKMCKDQSDLPIKHGPLWYVNGYRSKIYAPNHITRWLDFDIEREDTRRWWDGKRPNLFDPAVAVSDDE